MASSAPIVAGRPTAPDPSGLCWGWGWYWFTPGITNANVATLLYALCASIGLMTFMNFVQPYVLGEILHIPQADQGKVTGNLAALQEIVVISIMSFVGAWSDKIGRRAIFAGGFLILGIGYVVYPLAGSVTQLALYRILFAVGTAMIPVMMVACSQDYSQECTRGKWVGLTSVMNGLGVILMATQLAKMPRWIEAAFGTTKADAGVYAFWIVGGLSLLSAAITFVGLARITGAPRQRDPLLKLVREGLGAMAGNPRIALSYASAVATRGDVVIIGTYFSLWLVQDGRAAGMSTGEAMARAGFLFGAVIQTAAFLAAPIMGWICDRVNRVTGMIIAFGVAAAGYTGMGLIGDPFHSAWMIPVCLLLGIGETWNVVAGGVLIGQEAPARIRGSVLGVFNLFGAVGIALCVGAGGYLFDHWYHNGPFMMMGLINTAIVLASIYVRVTAGVAPAAAPAAAQAAAR
jgi:MFS family permease